MANGGGIAQSAQVCMYMPHTYKVPGGICGIYMHALLYMYVQKRVMLHR